MEKEERRWIEKYEERGEEVDRGRWRKRRQVILLYIYTSSSGGLLNE